MKKVFIFLIMGLFLISFVSAGEYKEVKYNEYKVLSQTNLELAYDVSFSEPNVNGTIIISACVENETKELIDLRVDKEWYEKVIDTITFWDGYEDYKIVNYTFIAPQFLKVENETDAEINYLIERDSKIIEKEPIGEIEETNEVCFKYSANPFDTPYIKLGDNSIVIIQDSDWITTSTLTNVTAESGASNHTHLNISNTAPWDSLVGYWNADGDLADTKLTTAYDWSGEGNNGTMVDDTVSTSSAGRYGKGFSFDGDGDWVDLGADGSLKPTAEVTFCAWVNPDTDCEAEQNIIRSTNNIGYTIGCGWTSQKFRVYISSSGYQSSGDSTTSITSGNWYYVCGTYDKNAGSDEIKLYVNGINENNGTTTGDIDWSSNHIFLGQYSGSAYYNGSMDDVMIFNTSLTSAQILEIYNNQSARFLETGTQKVRAVNIEQDGTYDRVNVSTTIQENMDSRIEARVGQINMSVDTTGLVAYYPMEWESPVDISGEGNDGTAVNAIWNSTGGRNETGGFSFDGDGDWVSITDAPGLSIGESDGYTISLWVYKDILTLGTESYTFVSKGSANNYEYKLTGTYYSNGIMDLRFLGFDNLSGSSNGVVTSALYSSPYPGKWYHVVAQWNNPTLSLYINGEYKLNDTATSIFGNGVAPVKIGNDWFNNFMNGSMDDVMIFNRSLSATEITNLYNNQSANHDGNPYYTDYKNITSETNETFTINTEADFVFPDYKLLAGNDTTSFYSPVILDGISIESFSGTPAEDTTSPTWSLNQTNNTIANQSTNFSLQVNDETALHPKGQYIFSTNNTGVWANESVVNFTATPSNADVIKTLNDTVGISIGYRWYLTDDAVNLNVTDVFSLVTTSAVCWSDLGSGKIYIPTGCQYYIDSEVYIS